VLVIDDEPTICWALERSLKGEGYAVVLASSAEEGLRIAREQKPALVLLDVRLPREDGLTALPKITDATGGAPVVIMTAFGDLESAVTAVERGAADYLTKPFKLEDVSRVCRIHLQGARYREVTARDTDDKQLVESRIVGTSPAIQRVFRQIALVASSELTVLITGETGTGKELVAAAIHRHSSRRDHPYLAIAPVALNPDLIESELFGHVRGAFTGAEEHRVGLFELAEGGTILLDEIGDLPLTMQAKLLRVLEQGEYCRVGETAPRRCNVRVLAATHCDLRTAVAEDRFREDLFYRLNGMHVHLPPLRERSEDIAPLCEHFLRRQGYPGADRMSVSLIDSLAGRPWYGNVRELKNAIDHAAVVARGRPLQLCDFPEISHHIAEVQRQYSLDEAVRIWAQQQMGMAPDCLALHSQFLAAAEPALLQFAIEESGGNRAKAAELLGIHRGTLRERLRAYGLDE
jgi:two-component system nitrogen regulation response regulator GlnG